MPRPLPSGPIPRYLQIADLIRQGIGRGRWRPGERLPTLETLIAEFGVARATVRQAIDTLAREGLVSPQQGRGTFVTGRPPEDRWFSAEATLAGIDRICREYHPCPSSDSASRSARRWPRSGASSSIPMAVSSTSARSAIAATCSGSRWIWGSKYL